MDIVVKLTDDRMKKVLMIDDMILLSQKSIQSNPAVFKEFIARFVIDPATGDYFPMVEVDTVEDYTISASPRAVKMAGKLSIEQLLAFADGLKGGVLNMLVPPSSAASSNTPE